MYHWLSLALRSFIPRTCTFCHQALPASGQLALCETCFAELPRAPNVNNTASNQPKILYAFYYSSPISHALKAVKFAQSLPHVQLMAQLTADTLYPRIVEKPEAILPVPLHSKRLRQRGFNQALELCKPLAQRLNIPLITHAIERSKQTEAQTTLNAEQRLVNMQQAFRVVKPLPYQHIALFDDVMTTGATLYSLAQLLQQHGVKRVDFYACARPMI